MAREYTPEELGIKPEREYTLEELEKMRQPESGGIASFKSALHDIAGQGALTLGKVGLMHPEEAEKSYQEHKQKSSEIYRPTEKGWTEDPFGKVSELLGGSVPYMAAPLIGAVAAPEVIGGSLVGAGLVSAGQFVGSNLARQLDEGQKEGKNLADTSLTSAVAASIPQALLDTYSLKMTPLIRGIFGKAGKEITEKTAEEIAKKGILGTITQTGLTANREGMTEAGQQVLERLQAGLNITDEEARKEYFDNYIGGAVLGGVLGTGGHFIEKTMQKESENHYDSLMNSLRTNFDTASSVPMADVISKVTELTGETDLNKIHNFLDGAQELGHLETVPNKDDTFSIKFKQPTPIEQVDEQQKNANPDIYKSEVFDSHADLYKAIVPKLKKFGLENVGVKIMDNIENGRADGLWANKIIHVAMDSPNPMGTMRHESVHALRELGGFKPNEWTVLSNKAKDEWVDKFIKKTNLYDQYKNQYQKDYGNMTGFDDYIHEEAIAEAFKHFDQTKPPAGMVGNIYERIRQLFETLRNGFTGNGFHTPDSIFRSLDEGKRTPVAPQQTTEQMAPQYAKRPDLTTKEGVIEDGIERYANALIKNNVLMNRGEGRYDILGPDGMGGRADASLTKVIDNIESRLLNTGVSKVRDSAGNREIDDAIYKQVIAKGQQLAIERMKKIDEDRRKTYNEQQGEKNAKPNKYNFAQYDKEGNPIRPKEHAVRPSEGSNQGISFNDRREGASTFVGHHYSKGERQFLSGSMYGSKDGIKGEEAKRLAHSKDPRIKSRVYFYIPHSELNGRYLNPEQGLGSFKHEQTFNNILAPGADMSRIIKETDATRDFNKFESAVVDAGYDGYAFPHMGMMVILNQNNVPVNSVGKYSLNKLQNAKFIDSEIQDLVKNIGNRIAGMKSTETLADVEKAVLKLQSYTKQGYKGRKWYENSAKAVLDAFNGDPILAEKFFQIIAITSGNTEVAANFTKTVKAWSQFANGEPIKVGTEDTNRKVSALLNFGDDWAGRKTNTFYTNLMEAMEGKDTGRSTIDLHMARMIFGKDQPTDAQYDLAEKMISLLASKAGMLPRQVQAASWVTQKAKSIYEDYKNQKGKINIPDKKLKLMALERALGDYSHQIKANVKKLVATPELKESSASIRARTQNITGEVIPSVKVPMGQAEELDFNNKTKITKQVVDSGKIQKIVNSLNLTSKIQVSIGAGGYESKVNLNLIVKVINPDPDISHVEALKLAKAMSYVFKQDATPMFRADPNFIKNGQLGYKFTFNTNELTPTQQKKILNLLQQKFSKDAGFTKINKNELVLINYRGEDGKPYLTSDNNFHNGLVEIANEINKISKIESQEVFGAQSEYPYHDWTDEPTGISLINGIQNSKQERFNLQGRLDNISESFKSDLRKSIEATGRTARFSLKVPNTPAFRAWFKGSKVVDQEGNPKLVYSGTSKDKDFTSFNVPKNGAWFTEDPEYASQYAKDNDSMGYTYEGWKPVPKNTASRVIPAFLNIKNPYKMTDEVFQEYLNRNGSYKRAQANLFERLRMEGYDGVDMVDGVWVVLLEPNQIKSVFNQNPTEKKDMRYSLPRLTKTDEVKSTTNVIKDTANKVWDDIHNDDYLTGLRVAWVDKISGLTKALGGTKEKAGLPQFDMHGKLRADLLIRAKSQGINLIKNGIQSGMISVQNDGTLGVERSENNLARSMVLADELDSKFKPLGFTGRSGVAEVARILRGEDILKDDAMTNAEGNRLVAQANAHLKMASDLKKLHKFELEYAKKVTKEAKVLYNAGKLREGNLKASEARRIYETNFFREILKETKEARKLMREGKPLQKVKRELQVTPEHIKWAHNMLTKIPEIEKVLDIWRAVNHGLVDLWVDTGLLDSTTATKFKAKDRYVPLFKSKEDLDAEGLFNSTGTGTKTSAKIHALKGAMNERNIWENIDKHYAKMVAQAYENQTRRIGVEQLKYFELAEMTTDREKANLIFKENGKEVMAIVENPNDLAAFQAMTYTLSPLMKTFVPMTKVLRAGALINPMYWIKQLIRDPIHGSLVANSGIVTPFHSMTEFARILMQNSEEARILAGRGVIGAVDNTLTMNEFLKQVGKEKTDPHALAGALHKIMEIHEASDAATRVAIYKKAFAEGMKKYGDKTKATDYAVFKARESINFSIHGNSPLLQQLRASIPFFSAAITSLDTVYRAATGYGLNAEEKAQARRIFASRAAMLAVMSTMYAMLYQDDDEYKKLPDYVKDNNWLIPTPDGKNFIRIPTPFEVGFLFKTIPEGAVRYMAGTSTGKELMASYYAGLLHNLPANGIPIPQAVKPIFETISNHSFFTGNPIEGMSDQGLPVSMRGQRATEFSKMLSRLGLDGIGLSPAKIDNLFQGYFAELGTFTTGLASDVVYMAEGKVPPAKNVENMPFMRAFLTDPNVSKAVADFYDLEANAKQMASAVNKFKNEGNLEGIKSILNDEDKKKAYMSEAPLRKIGEEMTKLRKAINFYKENQSIDPEMRRQKINELTQIYNKIAENGYKVSNAIGINR